MTFLEKLDILMKGQGLNKSKLSQMSGVPYTTIDGFYKKGYENAKISTIRKIAQALDCSLDYLIEDEPKEKSASTAEATPWAAPEVDFLRSTLLHNFDQLNQEGRERLVETSDDMVSSGKYIKSDTGELGKEQGA